MGTMMLRYARTRKEFDRLRGKIDYPKGGYV